MNRRGFISSVLAVGIVGVRVVLNLRLKTTTRRLNKLLRNLPNRNLNRNPNQTPSQNRQKEQMIQSGSLLHSEMR